MALSEFTEVKVTLEVNCAVQVSVGPGEVARSTRFAIQICTGECVCRKTDTLFCALSALDVVSWLTRRKERALVPIKSKLVVAVCVADFFRDNSDEKCECDVGGWQWLVG